MKNKAWFMVLLFSLSLLTVSVAFAGDIPESIVWDQSTEVILGTIESIGSEKITIKVSEYLFETLNDPVIEVPNFDYLIKQFTLSRPKVGDSCAVAIARIDDDIQIYYHLCAKADSLDKSTLKLDSSDDFVKRMNTYINNSTYSKENREELLSNRKNSLLWSVVMNPSTDVIVGTIESIGSEKTTIKVSEYLFETLNKPVIEIPNFNYRIKSSTSGKPKVGDSCVVVIGSIDDNIGIYYGAKTDSLDKSTLKLSRNSWDSLMESVNEYINDGRYSKKFREVRLDDFNKKNKPAQNKTFANLDSNTFIVICCVVIIVAFIKKALKP